MSAWVTKERYELQLMFEHPGFDMLLQQAMTSVGKMGNRDVAYSLLSMVNLGVPQGSRVIQTFLRNCQENLNDFDEKSLSILASSLRNMEHSNNTDALKDGVRMVVEARLPGIKNVMALQNMMRMLGEDAPIGLKQKFEAKALSMSNHFSLLDSQHMITAIARMNFYSKPLLDICSKIIQENINRIPFNPLFEAMQSYRQLQYRDLELLTDISEHAASKIDIWNKKQVVLFLSVLERLAFCPAAVMEAFAGKVIENPKALTLKDLLCVVKVYSTLNYDLQHRRQQFLDSLIPALVSYLPKMSCFELLKAPLLQSSTLEKFKSTDPNYLANQERMFQTVNLCLNLEHPVLPQPLTVPPTVLGVPVLDSRAVIPELSQCLQSVMEDQANTTLQERVSLLGFYFIDGVITKPLPSETDSGSAESRQRIAVICPADSSFCFGTSHPRGTLALKMRHLKTLGYDPVWVTEQELQSTPEEKRTDFLRDRIFPEHRSQAEVEKLNLNTNQESQTVQSS
ncbi:FAST kinase domain containing protein 2 mitochondrial [Dissostichus eleginoides]|uniref:FAST kinase domain containing protein 2 mitochondrial n=1 Tax=Dissostichus eleginoides TaxID=100907 RepID=A0AAD9B663_DISEL|nr:FAST kinase domain containing protein 2 mitochondrial [Dissostichus eleginoides]